MVLADPSRFAGQRIEIVGDELTKPEIASVLGSAIGRPVRYEVQSRSELDFYPEDVRRTYIWLNDVGYSADLEQLAADYPGFSFTPLTTWAGSQDWAALLGGVRASAAS